MVPFTFLLVVVCHWRHGLDAHGPENVFWPSLSPYIENSFLASSPEVVRRIRREVTWKVGRTARITRSWLVPEAAFSHRTALTRRRRDWASRGLTIRTIGRWSLIMLMTVPTRGRRDGSVK
jgi:hypothetical protein